MLGPAGPLRSSSSTCTSSWSGSITCCAAKPRRAWPSTATTIRACRARRGPEPHHSSHAEPRANAIQALAGGAVPAPRLVLRTRAANSVSIGARRHRLVASIQFEDNGPGVLSKFGHDFLPPWSPAGRRHRPGAGHRPGSRQPPRRSHRVRQCPGQDRLRNFSPNGHRMNAKPLSVWLVDDDASIRWVLEKALKSGACSRSASMAPTTR